MSYGPHSIVKLLLIELGPPNDVCLLDRFVKSLFL